MNEGFTCPISLTHSALLFWTVATPLAAAVVLMLGSLKGNAARLVSALGFTLPLLGALVLACNFGEAHRVAGYAFYCNAQLGLPAAGIALKLGLNGISLPLFVMAAIVAFAAGIYAIGGKQERQPLYLTLLLVMSGGLLGLFASIDLFFFYFFHELALIPTFIMMRRIQLTAWVASHAETPTAQAMGEAYVAGTVELARRFVAGNR